MGTKKYRVTIGGRTFEKTSRKRRKRTRRRSYRVKPRFKVLVIALCVVIVASFNYLLSPLVGSTQEASLVQKSEKKEVVQASSSKTPKVDKSSKNTVIPEVEKQRSEYLILVNKTHPIKKKDRPKDLIRLKTGTKEGVTTNNNRLRKAAANHFAGLVKAARKKGIEIVVTSAYRPYEYQKALHDRYKQADGAVKANTYSAKAGYSEHETGLCLDVSSPSVNYNLVQAYGTTEEGKWLARNAHKHGFIIRYPKGKEKITGYDYEPWHIRYVGKTAAGEIYKKNQTLEEYLNKI